MIILLLSYPESPHFRQKQQTARSAVLFNNTYMVRRGNNIMAIEKNNTLTIEGSGFSIFLNETIQNIKHTGALGLYCYLASQYSGFNICKKHLQNHFGIGKEHLETCFRHLRDLGLIEKKTIRNENGQFVKWNTTLKVKISRPPQDPENPDYGPENQNAENPDSGKPEAINKEIIINKESYIYTQNSDEDAFSQPLVSSGDTREVAQRPPDKPKKQKDNLEWFTVEQMLDDNPFNIPRHMLEGWERYRKFVRKPICYSTWSKNNKVLLKIKQKFGIDPIDAFETMVSEKWMGVELRFFESRAPQKRALTIQEVINA